MSVQDTITRGDIHSWVRVTRNDSQMLLGKEDIVPVSELIDKQDAKLSALRSRVAVLEGALAFYAEPLRWKSTSLYICGHRSPAPILTDEGHRARAALTKEPTP